MATLMYKQGEFTLRHALSQGHSFLANQKQDANLTVIQEGDSVDIVIELTVQPDWTVKENILTVQKKKALDIPQASDTV